MNVSLKGESRSQYSSLLILGTQFTLDKVQSMLRGIDFGINYNEFGDVAKVGEAVLTRAQLENMLRQLEAQGNT